MMQLPGNQASSSSGKRWLHNNELKTDHQSKIASAIRSVFAFWVTCHTYIPGHNKTDQYSLQLLI